MHPFSLNLWIFRFRLYIMRYKLTVGKNRFFPAHSSTFGSTPCDFPSSLHSLGVKISNWASLSISDTCESWLQCPEHIPQFLDDCGWLYSFGVAFNIIWIKLLLRIRTTPTTSAFLLMWHIFSFVANFVYISIPMFSNSSAGLLLLPYFIPVSRELLWMLKIRFERITLNIYNRTW